MGAVRGGRSLPDLSSYEARSVVIVRLKALGDIALSLPIVYAVRDRYPRARIRYLCRRQYAECLSGVRELDGILVLPDSALGQMSLSLRLRRENVDCVIDLLGSPRSAMLVFLTGARMRIGMDTGRRNWCYTRVLPRVVTRGGARIKCYTLESNRELIRLLGLGPDRTSGLAIGFPAGEAEKGWAREYIGDLGAAGSRIIGIVPGSTYRAKSWPEERFVELARRAREELGTHPVILWGPGEEALAARIAEGANGAALAPPMGIARLGALVSMLDLLVGIDSGPKHLAVMQGIPTVTLFGPTDPRVWDPMTAMHRVIRVGGDSLSGRAAEAALGGDLGGISPDMVLDEMKEVLGMRRGAASQNGKGGGA